MVPMSNREDHHDELNIHHIEIQPHGFWGARQHQGHADVVLRPKFRQPRGHVCSLGDGLKRLIQRLHDEPLGVVMRALGEPL